MGKITEALKKAAKERIERFGKVIKIQEQKQIIVHKMRESRVDARMVPYFDPKSLVSEQYKSLVTNLLALHKGKPPHIMVITSSVSSEGKTVTALNLAITLSHAIHKPKVLLIDADMRKGKVARYLGVEEQKGLSDYLAGKAQLEEIIFSIDIDHLGFISCGGVPSYPSDLLGSARMNDLLKQLRSQYEYILVDTPPVIPVTDAVIVGTQADGVLMVIKAGETQRGIVKRASELLQQADAKIAGHILTGIEYFVPSYLYRYL